MTMMESTRRNAPFFVVFLAIVLMGLAMSLAMLALLMRL